MALPASFHPEAEQDFLGAVRWYDRKHAGLGAAFAAAVQRAVHVVAEFPGAGSPLGPDLRRAFVHAFPYYVVYAQSSDAIAILAVAHFRQRPGFWRDRVSGFDARRHNEE